jgi:hypothetical protein
MKKLLLILVLLCPSFAWSDTTLQLDTTKTYCNHSGTQSAVYAWWTGGACTGSNEYHDSYTDLDPADGNRCAKATNDHNQPAVSSDLRCTLACCCWDIIYPTWTVTVDVNCARTSGDFDGTMLCSY